MSKETISNNYLQETKEKYLYNQVPTFNHVLVVGSNRIDNIGAEIATGLRRASYTTKEVDRDDWEQTLLDKSNEFTAIVLANGSTHLDWIEDYPIGQIGRIINDCLTTSILATRYFVNATIDILSPKYIIYIGSMAYNHVLNGSSIYCAAKAGLAHFSRCMAWELAPKNYNVYCIHPSNVEGTPMTEETIKGLMRYRGIDRKAAIEYWNTGSPRRYMLQAKDIANIVEFLMSGKAGYVSGSQIELGGGQR